MKTRPLEVTLFEASALARGLALLAERIAEPEFRQHAAAVESAFAKLEALSALAGRDLAPEAKA